MTELEVRDVTEEWSNDSIERVEIEVSHCGNMKTFVFEKQDTFMRLSRRDRRSFSGWIVRVISYFVYESELKFRRMKMEKDAAEYVWGEEEVDTIRDAYILAKQTAFERASLDDSLTVDSVDIDSMDSLSR